MGLTSLEKVPFCLTGRLGKQSVGRRGGGADGRGTSVSSDER